MPKFHPPGLLQALALALSAVTLNLAVPASASSALMRVPEAPAIFAGSAEPGTLRKVPHPRVSGIDVSHYQGKIDWRRVRAAGVEFAYIKATQANSYKDPRFNENYQAATRAGLVRGAYHFATPNSSSGRRQADFLVAHGGGWSADDRTLPAMLDLEANKRVSKDACYGLTDVAMVRWIRDFADRYHKRTSRWPVIYTSRSWWTQCTGNSSAFRGTSPLMLAAWSARPGAAPGHWATHTIWQYTDSGRVPGISGGVDLDAFNGSRKRLAALANNTR